jgi:deazaflavin-dependent oxidoreductase (nitroreductase family)
MAGDDMSSDTRAGTRGSWQPGTGGPVGRWLTKRAVNRIRRTGKMMGLGFDALVLTTIGRKTGVERTTPVGRFPGKDGSWLIVASAAGAPRHPAWYYNLAAHPDKVHIEMAGGKIAVTAESNSTEPSARKRGSRSPLQCPDSRTISKRPTVSCR